MTSAPDGLPTPFPHVLETLEDLRPLFRDPVPLVANKIASSIDEHTTGYLQACPLAFLATTNAAGRTVVSPRGGERGFINVLDGNRLLFADVVGNNLVESHQNIVETGQIGLLCVLPGQSETLRVDGRAWLTQDPDLLDMLDARDWQATQTGNRNTGRTRVYSLLEVIRAQWRLERRNLVRGHRS